MNHSLQIFYYKGSFWSQVVIIKKKNSKSNNKREKICVSPFDFPNYIVKNNFIKNITNMVKGSTDTQKEQHQQTAHTPIRSNRATVYQTNIRNRTVSKATS